MRSGLEAIGQMDVEGSALRPLVQPVEPEEPYALS